MSEIARWSYANTATVKPFLSIDLMSGVTNYGPEYTIACNWIAESTQQRADDGAEFISRHVIYTEDARPKYLDMIRLGDSEEWQEVRSKTSWDMNMFQDSMDFKLVT